ncbi:hypothetical protein [Thiohalobacter thiocyanaticus]|uniref:hypothetical protein n=1 Tax=Thiohalobacter thiocyanaticus TaxID=585455 RepID=UPI000F642C5E|nr:hypothetical protein [Thiohalobacter thiocyanaticus]
MSDYFEFEGTVTDLGNNKVSCKAVNGGEMVLNAADVKEENGKYQVKAGAEAEVTEMPSGNCPHSAPDTMMVTMGDCDRTACIGLVEVCCGSGRVLRGCIGAWGC